ncbi:MAG TPA: DNA-3-methyladenine glycosylase I [Solirubrobacterales bacterium]|nr:DNA-3-methyladenine glycosylase I [Solirubrobacterales bacterium]
MSELEDDGRIRCGWANGSEMMRDYHDEEWGIPVAGEQAMFERLSLEAFQAGLSWATILRKRPAFREAFRDFDLEYCAGLSDRDVENLMGNEGIIRARAKIEATRSNAAAAIDLRGDGGLEGLISGFAPARSPEPASHSEVPTSSAESEALAKELRSRGFKFVGPTNMYALMEAVGLVNTHLVGCFRRNAAG